jgi:hypothetical protein
MSWLSNLFASKSPSNPPPSQTPSTTSASSNKPDPESKLQQALEKVVEKRLTMTLSQQKQLEQQLLAWGESDIPSLQTSLPFQNPLGHLSPSEQKSYLANPPNEYIETLEERARVRETYEKEMFLADPLTHWRFAYSTKPDFSSDELPVWQRWSHEKRLEVMEKYRRYDERFQNKIYQIYTNLDTPHHREKVKVGVMTRIQRDAIGARQKKARITSKGKKAAVVDEIEEPPLRVVERRAFRAIVKQRNEELNRLWHLHLAEVSVFEDLTQDGLTLTEDRKKKVPIVKDLRNKENQRIQKALEDWSTMTIENKAEAVNWGAIYTETSIKSE